MDNQSIYKQFYEILKAKGASDEQITQMTQNLEKAASEALYAEALSSLTEEDLAIINKCPSQEEANKEILTRFTQNTGKSPDEFIQQFLNNFAQGFLAEHQKEQAGT